MDKKLDIYAILWIAGFLIFSAGSWYFLLELYVKKDKGDFFLFGAFLIVCINAFIAYRLIKKEYDSVESYLQIVIISLILIYFIYPLITHSWFTQSLGIAKTVHPQKNYDSNLVLGAIFCLVLSAFLSIIFTKIASFITLDISNINLFWVAVVSLLGLFFTPLFELEKFKDIILKHPYIKGYYKAFTDYNKQFNKKELETYWKILAGLIGFYVGEVWMKRQEHQKELLKEKNP